MTTDLRNALQTATQKVRRLLEDEVGDQLEGLYDVLDDGTIADAPGAHLDGAQRALRRRIVEAIEHEQAAGKTPAEAVAAFRREAAFTLLNRFVAIKMLEARDLIPEAVSKGEESAGFKNDFTLLAPGLSALPDKGYRLFLETLFDELGREVRVLFDRRATAGRIWPRRPALLKLLDTLNAPALADAWADEEAIGWVYQYFNDPKERRQIRDESAAPRNSYELALRNQFFTPDYVVRFLVDNTLGRIWWEMRRGDTALADDCQYLVRRADERFEEDAPDDHDGAVIAPRAPKDPRDLKILDPAAGSGHFLLYAFDVLATIYREAWEAEEQPASELTGRTLRDDYPTRDELHRALPRLVLAHNLHGVDIDPRTAQVAGLALWMRAQAEWNRLGVKRADREPVTKTNLVVAEPMPGERDLRDEFLAGLEPPALRPLVQRVFREMDMADEAGTLLPIETVVREEVEKARKTAQVPGLFDQAPADPEAFWQDAEDRVYRALDAYAQAGEQAESHRRRLFADDAARGFAFVDVCRQRYDVVLMNPPFGLATEPVYEWMRHGRYRSTFVDIYASFVSRGLEMLTRGGLVGAITSRAFLLTKKLSTWRKNELLGHMRLLLDLGIGVMDSAFVEACAYVISQEDQPELIALDAQGTDFESFLSSLDFDVLGPDDITRFVTDHDVFERLPSNKLLYSLPRRLSGLLTSSRTLEPGVATARQGMTTFSDARFVRSCWEVDPRRSGQTQPWKRFAKGGIFQLFYGDVPLVIMWGDGGAQLQEVNRTRNGQTAQARQASDYWYRPGLFYSKRCKMFGTRALPAGCVISNEGPAVLSMSDKSPSYLCGWLNSRLIRSLVEVQASAKKFNTGPVKKLPWHYEPEVAAALEHRSAQTIRGAQTTVSRLSEVNSVFAAPVTGTSVTDGWEQTQALLQNRDALMAETLAAFDEGVDRMYGVDSTRFAAMVGLGDDEETAASGDEDEDDEAAIEADAYAHNLVSYALGCAFGRWDVRYAAGTADLPEIPDPFAPLPACPPGMLVGADGLPAASPPDGYPLAFPEDGILVEDEGHPRDIAARIEGALGQIYDDASAERDALVAMLGAKDLRAYLHRGSSFFEFHRRKYSKSRRKAPIYWPLSTPSGSYTVWLYYPRLTRNTLFDVLKLVIDKVTHEEGRLRQLENELGADTSAAARKKVAAQQDAVAELRLFRDEIEATAPLWRPVHDDGVLINFAPLHRLFTLHRPWQKELVKAWKELAKGDYDWSHLAMHLWPERVVPLCAERADIALAHGLEGVFFERQDDGSFKRREEPTQSVESLVAKRQSPAVQAARDHLLSNR